MEKHSRRSKHVVYPLILILLLAGPGNMHAQDVGQGIHGTIRDAATLVPLDNVNIALLNTQQGAISDPAGKFTLANIPPGNYRISVTRIGYETLERSVRVQADEYSRITLYLPPRVIELGAVGVVGRSPSRDIMALPLLEPRGLEPVRSLISRKEIQKQGATTLIEAMKFVQGGLTETRGRKVKQFYSVRGQKYPYPDYAINGIWQKEFHEVPYFFSPYDIEEIEIVRSSAALLTGLSGLSGVIKLKTREYDSMETSMQLEYGSFETFHGNLSHGGRSGNFSYAAGIGYDRTAGLENKHAAENMLNASGRIRWDPMPNLSFKANFFHLNGRQELRKAEPPASQRFQDMLQSFDRIRTTLVNVKTYYRPTSWTSSELHIYYSERKPVFLNEADTTTTEESDSEWGLNFTQAFSLSSANTLRVGGLYNHWLAPNGKRFYVGKRCDTETVSFVVADEHKLGQAILDAGFRWTRTFMNEYGAFNIEGSGGRFRNVDPIVNEWQSPVIQGNIGFTYNFEQDMSVHLHAGIGQLKPREGALDTALNEPANETRIKLDLGLIKNWNGGGKLALTPFYVKQLDAIVYSGDTYTHPVTLLIMELYENREQDQYGVELETRSPRLLNLFSAFYNITIMSSGILTDGERARNREHPAWITNGGIFLDREGFDLNILGKYVYAFENDLFTASGDGPQPLGDFFTMDITGGYTIGTGKSVRIYFKAINITNRRYSTVVGYPDFGRRFGAGVRFTI